MHQFYHDTPAAFEPDCLVGDHQALQQVVESPDGLFPECGRESFAVLFDAQFRKPRSCLGLRGLAKRVYFRNDGQSCFIDGKCKRLELFFPDMLNDVLEKQLRKGDFLDAIFYCPYDIHELVTEEYLSKILWELNEDHKELLFLCAVRLFSSTRIAKIRNQSDRNIRKVRGTMLKKIRKKLLPALWDKAEKQQPMTLLEKDFLEENMTEIDSEEKK